MAKITNDIGTCDRLSMRLDKYVAKAADLTRSQAKKLISAGQVTIDTVVEKSSGLVVSGSESISLSGNVLTLIAQRYILLNKPKGYLCSSKDEQYPSALNLLQVPNKSKLHFAGRLDVDTTGLVLISDDGQWTHRITSPKYRHNKTYAVDLTEKLSDTNIETLSSGVLLKDSDKLTATAQVDVVKDAKIRLTITEGRYHQVKRMIAAVGSHVTNLHRESIGSVTLGDQLKLGGWRYLTSEEIKSF